MAITVPNDYRGYYQIAGNSFSDVELEAYIDREQSERLMDLLGVSLYDLFVADLVDNVPQSARFFGNIQPDSIRRRL